MRKLRRLGVMLVLGMIMSFLCFALFPRSSFKKRVNIIGYLVNTSVCKIPDVHPFDATVKYIINKGEIINCERFPTFTYESNRRIYINWEKVNNSAFKGKLSHCRIWPIIRPVNNTSDHNSFVYLEKSLRFNNFIATDHEQIHIKCFNKEDKVLFQNFHTLIFEKDDVEKRCKDNLAKVQKLFPEFQQPLSVQIVVVDSVSRLNSIRFMNRTRDFLLNEMEAVDMKGYNKVGYGTFHNMIPVLTGKFYEELPYSFKSPTAFDNFTFIWNKYSDHGFRTYYAEDYPNGAMFDYQKKGFHKTPTDYYNRHLLLSMYDQPNIIYNEENCILDRLQTQWVHDPAYKFIKLFKNRSYFSIILLTRLTHDKLERTASADDIYLNFLKTSHEANLLNNTILVFMADHGMRFGPIRESYIGFLEERLPMLYIVLPKWFSRKYPLHMKNLRINSKRLTTPFDLHRTLADLLLYHRKLSENSITRRDHNLFSEIPKNRTCADAGIEMHWCTCSRIMDVDVKSNAVQHAAMFFVANINKQLDDVTDLCEKLNIDELLQSYQAEQKDNDSKDDKNLISYKIVLRTKPGGGLFEGTVTYNSESRSYKMSSEISRINAYGKEKRCNVNHLQERLCYCRNNKQKQ